jgi:hypothetical protein
MSAEPDTMRADLEAAIQQHEDPDEENRETKEEAGRSEQNTEEPIRTTSTEEGTQNIPSAEDQQPDQEAKGGESSRTKGGAHAERAGDTFGTTAEEEEEAALQFNPPNSWRADERQHWNSLPDPVKSILTRREQDFSRGIEMYKEAANYGAALKQAIGPHESLLMQENPNGVGAAIAGMAQTVTGLRQGTPMEKAQTIAHFIRHYGVDIGTLDDILAGNAPGPGAPDPVSEAIQREMAPIKEFMTSYQQSQQKHQQAQISGYNSAIDEFAASGKAPYFDYVVDDMADIMEMAGRRGTKMSLEQAYERACALNPEVSSAIDNERKAQKLAANADRMQGKRAAASGIPSGATSSAGNTVPAISEDEDLRSTLLRAYKQHNPSDTRV